MEKQSRGFESRHDAAIPSAFRFGRVTGADAIIPGFSWPG
jgi:hypothetical protein